MFTGRLTCERVQIISFYEKPAEFCRRKNSDEGEVPNDFRALAIELSVECAGLHNPDTFRSSRFYITLDVKHPQEPMLNRCWRSEDVERECNPSFIQRLLLPGLSMKGSQKVARETNIRVTAWARSASVGTASLLLSDVLWSRFECAPLKRGRGSSVTLRANSYATPTRLAYACLTIDCTVSPTLATALSRGTTLFYEVLRCAEKAQWVPVVRSEMLAVRKSLCAATHFQRAHIGLDALLAGDADRTLRIRISRQGSKSSTSLGVAQFHLCDFISSANTESVLNRMRSADDPLDVGVRVDKLLTAKGNIYVKLTAIDASNYDTRPEVVSFMNTPS